MRKKALYWNSKMQLYITIIKNIVTYYTTIMTTISINQV